MRSHLNRVIAFTGLDILASFLLPFRGKVLKPKRRLRKPIEPKVVIVKSPQRNVELMVREALDCLGDLGGIVCSDSTVLIKPNVGFSYVEANTNPKVVEAVVKVVKEHSPRRIVIAESSVRGSDTTYNFMVTGLYDIARKYGVEMVDLKKTKDVVTVETFGSKLKTVRVYKLAYEADVIISMPKLKRHVEAGVTISLKNMMGTLPDSEKGRFHLLGLHQCIVDLNTVLKPDLAVIDALDVMTVTGPSHGEMVKANMVIVSKDPIAADAIAALELFKLEGIDSPLNELYKIEHIIKAGELGLGEANPEKIEVLVKTI